MAVDTLIVQARRYGSLELTDAGTIKVEGKFPKPLIVELKAHKEELRQVLREEKLQDRDLVDELERVMQLGQRLAKGEIMAIRCGISGELCRLCEGVPCKGSVQWEAGR